MKKKKKKLRGENWITEPSDGRLWRTEGWGEEAWQRRERERESGEREGEESGCDPHPEMLCWLREDEMSVQELLQRVQCVITHVGKSFIFVLLFFPLLILLFIFHTFSWNETSWSPLWKHVQESWLLFLLAAWWKLCCKVVLSFFFFSGHPGWKCELRESPSSHQDHSVQGGCRGMLCTWAEEKLCH